MEERGLLPRERVQAGVVLARLGDPRTGVVPSDLEEMGEMEFCYVPPGTFAQGDVGEKFTNGSLVQGYWIARFPVSTAQFELFVRAGGYGNEAWWPKSKRAGYWEAGQFKGRYDSSSRASPAENGPPFELANHPVVGVTWYEALAYCRWLRRLWKERLPSGYAISLPSEAEWEKAARGGAKIPDRPLVSKAWQGLVFPQNPGLVANPSPRRVYPWVGEFDSNNVNCPEIGVGATSPVGCFPSGASPYGVEEMSGNVWEWCRKKWVGQPRQDDGGQEGGHPRVLRGGAFYNIRLNVSCSCRSRRDPDYRDRNIGFRVVASPFVSEL
jgi:formylglycine-generating enzyme required for sulfatase activity